MRDANGESQYFLTDHLGSVVAITNDTSETSDPNDKATLTSQQRYLPFGGTRAQIGTSPRISTQTDIGYTSQRALDSGMGGLMDYKARFYSPCIMQLTQLDTIIPDPTSPQACNRYSYVKNSPVNFYALWGIKSAMINTNVRRTIVNYPSKNKIYGLSSTPSKFFSRKINSID